MVLMVVDQHTLHCSQLIEQTMVLEMVAVRLIFQILGVSLLGVLIEVEVLIVEETQQLLKVVRT